MSSAPEVAKRQTWNKGKLIGQKTLLKVKDIWAVRIRLQLHERKRDLVLFHLGLNSNLRGCDSVRLRVSDIFHGNRISSSTTVMQQKI